MNDHSYMMAYVYSATAIVILAASLVGVFRRRSIPLVFFCLAASLALLQNISYVIFNEIYTNEISLNSIPLWIQKGVKFFISAEPFTAGFYCISLVALIVSYSWRSKKEQSTDSSDQS